MNSMKQFGKFIAKQRKQKNMTQEAFAFELGITPQAVSKWENGIGYPDVTLFPAIAEILDVSIEELFGKESPRTEKKFPETYREMSLVFSRQDRACYSDKTVERIDETRGVIYFTDGSEGEMGERLARNRGEGEIAFLEYEEAEWEQSGPLALNEETDSFHSLAVSIDSSCELRVCTAEDGRPRMEAQGSHRFIAALRREITDGTLIVSMKSSGQNGAQWGKDNHLRIYTDFLEGTALRLEINGNGTCRIAPSFETVKLSINGSGDVRGNSAHRLQVTINGSGDVTFTEARTEADVHINGSGCVRLIEARDPKIRINGSGNIDLERCVGTVNIKIRGSGDVACGGEADNLICDVQGSGELHCEGLTVTDADLHARTGANIHIGRIKGTSVERLGKTTCLKVDRRG